MKTSKRSKFLALLLSSLLLISMLPTVAFAAAEVATAKNGTTITKDTTQEELNAWAGEGAITIESVDDVTVVTLQKDFKLGKLGGNDAKADQPISFGKYPDSQNDKMILNLNGHLISSDTMVIVSRCDLTIKDSVGNGKVFMDTSDSKASWFEAVVNQRKLTIESGNYEAKVHPDSSTAGVIGSAIADVETVIAGGVFIGSGSAINVKSGTTTIKGGNFEAANYGVIAQGTAVVNFPTDTKAEVISTKFPIVVGTQNGNTGKVNINGGNFDGTNADALVGRIGGADPTQSVTIEGGTFTQDPTNYTVSAPVAQVGEPFFVGAEQINQAVKDVNAGTSVKVTKGNVDLINVPDGVIIENKGGGDVSVNGEPVAPSESHTTHTHSWGQPIYIWSADHMTCTAQRVCTKDPSHIETAAATVTSEETKASTCTEKGELTYRATFSETWASQQTATVEIMETGHSYGEPEWTWSEDGKRATATFICENDGSHVEEITAAVASKVKTEASCTEKGTTTYTATVTFNGQEYTAVKDVADIPALNHDMGEWQTVISPNCTDKGSEKRSCSRCAYSETRDLDPNGHKWEEDFTVDKAASCTEDGSKSIHCVNCDAIKDSTVIPATGHKYDDGVITENATCTEKGVKTFTCNQCNETYTEEIPALGHQFANGVCSVCNEADPNYKEHEVTDGSDSIWNKGDNDGVSIGVPTEMGDVNIVTVDGKELTEGKDYTEENGKVIMNPDVLEKLAEGKHTVIINGENGYAQTTVTVEKKAEVPPTDPDTENPQTGGGANLVMWAALVLACIGGLSAILLYKRKSSKSE